MLSVRPDTPSALSTFRPSLSMDTINTYATEVVYSGWLWKQGGARGGRKNWKRRYFVLKHESLYYYASQNDTILLGVMPLHSSVVLDFEEQKSPLLPPPLSHSQTLAVTQTKNEQRVCHECKRPFSLTLRKHACRSCHNAFCQSCSSRSIPIPKYNLLNAVRVCDLCYDEIYFTATIAAKREEREEKQETVEVPLTKSPVQRNVGGFTLPSVLKPNLFALKNSERELWLHADTDNDRRTWIRLIREIQQRSHQSLAEHQASKQASKQASGENDANNDTNASTASNGPIPTLPQWEIDYGDITLLNRVGSGSFGEVFRGRLWQTEVAIKKLKTESLNDFSTLDEIKKEISILSQLRHPNVVLYLGASTTMPNVAICTEWCSRGSLYDVLHDYSVHINTHLIIELAMGIAQGCNYLHSLSDRIIHRDLKSSNVLVNKNWQVKVADFGLSHVKRKKHSANTGGGGMTVSINHDGNSTISPVNSAETDGEYDIVGTAEWLAPEVIEGKKYNEKIDVWSFGIVLTELVTRQIPYRDQFPHLAQPSYLDIVDAVLDDGALPTIPKWIDSSLRSLILNCLNRFADDRPSFNEIIMKLRELSELDESVLLYQWDLPRMLEQLYSPSSTMQALAASELATTIINNPRIRRTSTDHYHSHCLSFSHSDNDANTATSNDSNTVNAGRRASLLQQHTRTPSTAPQVTFNTTVNLPMTPKSNDSNLPFSPSQILLESSLTMMGDHSVWLIEDEVAASFIERLTALLNSSYENVQLSCCFALSALLSRCDASKRLIDRELIVNEGGIRSLLALITSPLPIIVQEASNVLLLLTSDLTRDEMLQFTGFDSQGLNKLMVIIEKEIINIEKERIEINQKSESKKELLKELRSLYRAQTQSYGHGGQGSSSHSNYSKKKPRVHRSHRSRNHSQHNSPTLDSQSLSSHDNPLALSLSSQSSPTQSSPGRTANVTPSHLPKFQPVAKADASTNVKRSLKLGASSDRRRSNSAAAPATHSDQSRSRSGRQSRVYSLSGLGSRPDSDGDESEDDDERVIEVSDDGSSICLAPPVNDTEQSRLSLLQSLIDVYSSSVTLPESWTEYYGTIAHQSYLLHWDSECKEWKMVFAIFVANANELRVFHRHSDECDDAALVLRTKSVDQSSTVKLRPHYHSMPHCFTIVDLTNHTFAAGLCSQLTEWTSAVNGDSSCIVANSNSDKPELSLLPSLSSIPASDTDRFHSDFANIRCLGYLYRYDNAQWKINFYLLNHINLYAFESHHSSSDNADYQFEVDTNHSTSVTISKDTDSGEFSVRIVGSKEPLTLCAVDSRDRRRWTDAIVPSSSSQPHSQSSSPALTPSQSPTQLPVGLPFSPSTLPHSHSSSLSRFLAHFGYVDHSGYINRKKRFGARWLRHYCLLVDSELYCYQSDSDDPDAPALVIHICTQSGKPFPINKNVRNLSFEIANPSGSVALQCANEAELRDWIEAIKQNVNKMQILAMRRRTTVTSQP